MSAEGDAVLEQALELLRGCGREWVLVVKGPDGRLYTHAAELPPPKEEPKEAETFDIYDAVLGAEAALRYREEPGAPMVPCVVWALPANWPPEGVPVPHALAHWGVDERLVVVRAYCEVCDGSCQRPELALFGEESEVFGPCPACGGTGDYCYHKEKPSDGEEEDGDGDGADG